MDSNTKQPNRSTPAHDGERRTRSLRAEELIGRIVESGKPRRTDAPVRRLLTWGKRRDVLE